METTFKFSEEVYQNYLTRIQTETGLKLTEYEAGLCRAILDIRSENSIGGACLGSAFKNETKRLLKEKLIHKPTFQFTGVCVPTGKLKTIVEEYTNNGDNLCASCGKPMDGMEHNYGTEEILTCIHCFTDAQNK